MATKEHSTHEMGILPSRLRSSPTASVPKLQRTSSCPLLTLLMSVTARAIE